MTDFNMAFQDQFEKPLSPLPSAHEIAREIVRRDQRRTRVLAAVCLVLWIVAAAGMLLMVTGLNQFVMGVRLNNARRYMQLQAQNDTKQASNGQDGKRETGEQQPKTAQADVSPLSDARQIMLDDGTDLLHHSLPLVDGSLAALLLAALSTVLLIFSSRRTTLNRINLSLMQISEELKQIRHTPSQNH
jgi:hypothetical protein